VVVGCGVARPGRPRKTEREFAVADVLGFGFLAAFFPPALIDRVLLETGRVEQRLRLLPSKLVVYYVLAMALYASEGYRELFRLLSEGLRSLDPALAVVVPQKSAFSKARERVGSEPLRRLFEEVARPMAEARTLGAWYRSWRVMSIDGSTLEVPDTLENAERFGRPGVSRGERSAYPRLRWVALGEVGTRAIVGLSVGALREAEVMLAKPLLARLEAGMLCVCDGAYFGFDAWQRSRSGGAELLWRLKHNAVFHVEERLADGSFLSQLDESPNDRRKGLPGVRVRIIEEALDDPGRPHAAERYRLATTILDPRAAPAEELAALYAKRWDIEISIRDVEVSQGRPQPVLRSRKPDGVIQELFGFVCVHYAIRWLLHQAALGANVDPDRLSFTGGLRALRRILSRPESSSPQELAQPDR
jgi:hypothetical protein